jgi:hypothetical protein
LKTHPTLRDLFVNAAKKLRAEYEEACVEPHPAQRGAERETLLTSFLSARLPQRFALAKGHTIDICDESSPQLDIMVYNAAETVVYRPTAGGTFIPYDSLLAGIEVKSALNRTGLHDAFQAAARTKSLQRAALKVGNTIHGPRPAPPMFLFAFRSDLSTDEITDAFIEEFFTTPPGGHLDCVFVMDQCDVSMYFVGPAGTEPVHLFLGQPSSNGESIVTFVKPGSAQVCKGLLFHAPSPGLIRVEAWETGELTLWAFLRLLTVVLQPGPVFGAWVPWNAADEMDFSFRNIGICIDAKTPHKNWQAEFIRVFEACGRIDD